MTREIQDTGFSSSDGTRYEEDDGAGFGDTRDVAIVVFCTALLFLSTYFVANRIDSLREDMARYVNEVKRHGHATRQRLKKLEQEINFESKEGWSKADQVIWCARTERMNSAMEWKCGDADRYSVHQKQKIWQPIVTRE